MRSGPKLRQAAAKREKRDLRLWAPTDQFRGKGEKLNDTRGIDALFAPRDDDLYLDLPPPIAGELTFWGAHPADEVSYERFIDWVLILASKDGAVVPMRQEEDWHEEVAAHGFRHALIDWTSQTEGTGLHRGAVPGGWIVPDCLRLGGTTRVRNDTRRLLASLPGECNLERREFSFVTSEVPTWIEDDSRRDHSLFEQLISPLVYLQGTSRDNLHGWLDQICEFCAGEPVAFISRYTPSPAAIAIGNRHGVTLAHMPLSYLPEALLARNCAYRSMHLSLSQWRAFESRLREVGLYEESHRLRAHDGEVL